MIFFFFLRRGEEGRKVIYILFMSELERKGRDSKRTDGELFLRLPTY